MNKWLIEYTLIAPLYVVLQCLRLVFVSSHVGAVVHNFMYYWCFRALARNPNHSPITDKLGRALCDRRYEGVIRWQRRIYESSPAAVRHSLKNVFIRRFVVGSFRRRRLAQQGHTIPLFIQISVNTPEAGCNLACTGCYAVGHNNDTIPREMLRKVIAEQEVLGIYHVMLLGGEPFLYKGIVEIMASYPNTSFYVPTNGTMLTRDIVWRLAELGNVCPMISLEGFEQATDAVRGRGVYRQVLAAMQLCKEAKIPYVVTATVTKHNREEVTSQAFLELLDSYRCCGVNYSCYVPIGRHPQPELQLSSAESEELDAVSGFVLRRYAMYPTIGRNGTARVNDCSAAREYFHVLPDGQVESCPFAQWADPNLNVRDRSILDITASPFFTGIRELNSYGIAGAAPCRAPKLVSLQNAFKQLGAKPTIRQTVTQS